MALGLGWFNHVSPQIMIEGSGNILRAHLFPAPSDYGYVAEIDQAAELDFLPLQERHYHLRLSDEVIGLVLPIEQKRNEQYASGLFAN